jgi:hypothetical protein
MGCNLGAFIHYLHNIHLNRLWAPLTMKLRFSFVVLAMLIHGLLPSTQLFGQSSKPEVPRFERVAIAETGAAVYLPKGEAEFEMSLSEDGSEVYTGEIQHGDYYFSVVAVRFVPEMAEMTPDDMEGLLLNYMEFLHSQIAPGESAGVGTGHTKEKVPNARGAIDYWLDAEGDRFAVKGWIDHRMIGVMILYGPDEYPIFNVQQMFLDGFRFPNED